MLMLSVTSLVFLEIGPISFHSCLIECSEHQQGSGQPSSGWEGGDVTALFFLSPTVFQANEVSSAMLAKAAMLLDFVEPQAQKSLTV